MKRFKRRYPEDSPRRNERPENILERYLKRNLKNARVQCAGANVLVKYYRKHYCIFREGEFWYVSYLDLELGKMPMQAPDASAVRAIILSDTIVSEPVGDVP